MAESFTIRLLTFSLFALSVAAAGDSLKKCCPNGEGYDSNASKCVQSSGPTFDPNLIDDNVVNVDVVDNVGTLLKAGANLPACKGDYRVLQLDDETRFNVSESDGHLVSVSVVSIFLAGQNLGDFCVDVDVVNKSNVAVVCDPCAQDDRFCIRLCCAPGQIYSITEDEIGCTDSNITQKVDYDLGTDVLENEDYVLIYDPDHDIVCPINTHLSESGPVLAGNVSSHEFFESGALLLTVGDLTEKISRDLYCVGFRENKIGDDAIVYKSPVFEVCFQETDEEQTFGVFKRLYPFCCTVSNFFLVLTFAVYIILPDLHGPLFGKVVLAFIMALFLAYLTMSINYFKGLAFVLSGEPNEKNPACQFLGYFIQFCFLHAFLWMNVLSYEIFCRFCNFSVNGRHLGQGNDTVGRKKKLACYTAYAVGVALAITGISLILDFGVDEKKIAEGFVPKMGNVSCFFDRESKPIAFLLFYLPLLLIQIANVGFFAATIRKLRETWTLTRATNLHSTGSQLNNSQVDNFKVGARIFLIMGINWFFEILSFVVNWSTDDHLAGKIIFYCLDFVNLLQGLLLFVVLVCKKSTFKKLKEKFDKVAKNVAATNKVAPEGSSTSSDRKDETAKTISSQLSTSTSTPPTTATRDEKQV